MVAVGRRRGGTVTGDRREGFEQLCRDEYANLVRTAYFITGDREEALDIAQETLARAYERWKTVSALDRPGAWLQRVAGNLSLSWRRRQRLQARHRSTSMVRRSEESDTSYSVVIEALDTLTPSQRAAVVLRYLGDLPVAEVARALSKRPGTVRALTSQGLARLRLRLADDASREDHDEVRS
jgi:RNA polymerase sigma factor (sigma-70 family)